MENVLRNRQDNKAHKKQKDLGDSGSKAGKAKPNRVGTFGSGLLEGAISLIAGAVGVAVISGLQDGLNRSKQENKEPSEENYEKYSSNKDETNNRSQASPREHNVKGHGQHYHTKEGTIWKEKEPYTRGKKNKED